MCHLPNHPTENADLEHIGRDATSCRVDLKLLPGIRHSASPPPIQQVPARVPLPLPSRPASQTCFRMGGPRGFSAALCCPRLPSPCSNQRLQKGRAHVCVACWRVGLLACWRVGVLACWRVGVLACWCVCVCVSLCVCLSACLSVCLSVCFLVCVCARPLKHFHQKRLSRPQDMALNLEFGPHTLKLSAGEHLAMSLGGGNGRCWLALGCRNMWGCEVTGYRNTGIPLQGVGLRGKYFTKPLHCGLVGLPSAVSASHLGATGWFRIADVQPSGICRKVLNNER